MKHVSIHLFAVLSLLIGSFTACDNQSEFTVKGVVSDADGQVMYLENVGVSNVTLMDSVKLNAAGKFQFKKPRPAYPDFYRLRLNNQLINFSIDSTETVSFVADAETFATSYTVEGSENGKAIKNITLAQLDANQVIQRLRKAYEAGEVSDTLYAEALCGELHTFVPDRLLDDDGAALLRYEGGARGVLMASQVAVGQENSLRIRVYGEKGGLEWHQEEPNTLLMRWPDRQPEVIRTGGSGLSAWATANTRTPAGHPEGYLEAFANLYRHFAAALQARLAGEEPTPTDLDFPSVEEGVRGMQFIETIVSTKNSDQKWVSIID